MANTVSMVAAALFASSVYADAPPAEFAGDNRYCRSTPERDASGRIKRSRAVLLKFVAIHPCPSSGVSEISCEGWQIDHVIPLACGGCDVVENLQHLPVKIKVCRKDAPLNKDCWERKIYCEEPTQ